MPSPSIPSLIRASSRATQLSRHLRLTAASQATAAMSTTHASTPVAMTQATISTPSKPSPAPSDVAAKAHHRKDGKGFVNPWPSFSDRQPAEFFKWMAFGGFNGTKKKVDLTGALPPVRTPQFLAARSTPALRATWLGHASYFVEFPGGLRVLTDPVFTPRCSPFDFLGPKRYTRAPCQVAGLPAALDVVVLSHNHYDHLSLPTLRALADRYPHARFFVPLGVKAFLEQELGAAVEQKVTELDWWEEREVTLSKPASASSPSASSQTGEEADAAEIKATFSCLPAQHMTARGLFDRYQTLWASWGITSGGKKLWFAGDTGYRSVTEEVAKSDFDYAEEHALPTNPAFKQIGELRGPFDLGLIPIGAYEPRYLMSPVHVNPYDAVNIFLDTKCQRALSMHWGAWVLTQEPVLEPPSLLKKALKWKGVAEEGAFDSCEIGESREF